MSGEDESSDPFADSAVNDTQRYTYRDEHGDKVMQVRREPRKKFTQCRWNGNRWVPRIKGVRRIPYRLPELIAAARAGEVVYVCEGEKDVHTLVELGLVATCNPGGVNSWRDDYNQWFEGAQVRIVADNDPVSKGCIGQKHAADIFDSLSGVAATVEVFLPKSGKDVTDHVEAGHTVEDFVPTTASGLRALAGASAATPSQRGRSAGDDELVVPEVLVQVLGLLAAGGSVGERGPNGGDWPVTCPLHDDGSPSATVNIGDHVPVVFRCHTGCNQNDFFDYLVETGGVTRSALMEDSKGPFADDGSSWAFIDPWPYLNGETPKNLPTVGRRTDGVALIYPGLIHMFAGESGSGKSWIVQYIAAQEVLSGRHVVYLDYESGPAEVFERLLALSSGDRDAVAERFHYVRPDESFAGDAVALFRSQVGPLAASLVVVDGVSDAMGIDGLSINDNDDAVKFGATMKRLRTESGAAVAMIDHVTKSSEGPRGNPIGAQHKKSFIDGALYMVDVVRELVRGSGGRSKIRTTTKDRPGEVKPHAVNKVIAYFVMAAETGDSIDARLEPPDPNALTVSAKGERDLEDELLALLTERPDELTWTELRGILGGKSQLSKIFNEWKADGVIRPKKVKRPDADGKRSQPVDVWALPS